MIAADFVGGGVASPAIHIIPIEYIFHLIEEESSTLLFRLLGEADGFCRKIKLPHLIVSGKGNAKALLPFF